jgi:tetratricopeptide (TPR) repeat protein
MCDLPILPLGFLILALTASGASAVQVTPSQAREAFVRAQNLESQGDESGALALLWYAAGANPHDADVQNGLGEALERLGAFDPAIDAYQRAVAERPGFRKAENHLILGLVKAGRGPEALDRARALVAGAPKDPDRLFTLGLAQSELDVDQAITTFSRVLELDHKNTLAWYNLALVFKRSDRLGEAVDALSHALAIERRPEVLYTLGVVYWQQGDVGRAAATLKAATDADPRSPEAQQALGSVLAARGDWKGAADALRRAIALRPGLPGGHETLARVLRQSGDTARAAEEYSEAERLRRRHEIEQEAGVRTAVGTRKAEAGDLTGALDEFRRATAIFEDYAPAHFQIGLVLRRLGDLDASQAAFDRATKLDPRLVAPPASR